MEHETLAFSVDGKAIVGEQGQSILDACEAAGVYIPKLCDS